MIGQQIFQPGYPIDARPRDRVARLQEKAIGDFEYAAARVVARLTGEPVTLQDDGSQDSMPDIRIDFSYRPSAFMEVWTDIDENYAATWALLMKRQHQLPYVAPSQRLARAWQITIGRTTQDVVMLDRGSLMRYVRTNASVVQKNVAQLVAEFDDLGCVRPTILTLGDDTSRLVAQNVPNTLYSRLVPLMHYANYISQEDYRLDTLKRLGSHATG